MRSRSSCDDRVAACILRPAFGARTGADGGLRTSGGADPPVVASRLDHRSGHDRAEDGPDHGVRRHPRDRRADGDRGARCSAAAGVVVLDPRRLLRRERVPHHDAAARGVEPDRDDLAAALLQPPCLAAAPRPVHAVGHRARAAADRRGGQQRGRRRLLHPPRHPSGGPLLLQLRESPRVPDRWRRAVPDVVAVARGAVLRRRRAADRGARPHPADRPRSGAPDDRGDRDPDRPQRRGARAAQLLPAASRRPAAGCRAGDPERTDPRGAERADPSPAPGCRMGGAGRAWS